MFWDFGVLELLDLEMGDFSILCTFKNCEDDFVWVFTMVYEPSFGKGREGIWEDLRAI